MNLTDKKLKIFLIVFISYILNMSVLPNYSTDNEITLDPIQRHTANNVVSQSEIVIVAEDTYPNNNSLPLPIATIPVLMNYNFQPFRSKTLNYFMAFLNFFLFLILGSVYIHKRDFIVGGVFIAISGGELHYFLLPILFCAVFMTSFFGRCSNNVTCFNGNNLNLSDTVQKIIWFSMFLVWVVFVSSGISQLHDHNWTAGGVLLFFSQLIMSTFFLPLCIYSHHVTSNYVTNSAGVVV